MKEYTERRFTGWEDIMKNVKEIFAMRKISNIHIVALKDVIWEEKTQVLYLIQDLMDT